MIGRASALLAALLAPACVGPTAPVSSSVVQGGSLPTASRLSPAGYLTIGEVPPSRLPEDPPPEPGAVDDLARDTSSADPEVRARAWERVNGSPAFQQELQKLMQVLPAQEPENFVELRIVRDPGVAAEVWFKRHAASTLARYTSDPLFRPRQGGLSREEQEHLRSLWAGRMKGADVINMLSVDPIAGTVEIGSAVEEAEFRRIAAEQGWELGPSLRLMFPQPRPPAFLEPSLARYVRVFPRESKAKGIQLTGGYSGRVVLVDGCFRLQSQQSGELGPLVLFGRQTQLGLDDQGYLVVFSEDRSRRYRIGEIGSWPGPNSVDESDPDVRKLRQHCGGDPITNVAEPQSARLFSLPFPDRVADYARAHSLSYRQAWQQVLACIEREERRGRRGLEARDLCIRQFN